jgi:RNA polymerase sigma-70 factor (sigma-E family)
MRRATEVTTGGAERVEGGVLEELYLRHADRATRVAYLLTGDRALAEDLVQEAFLRLAGRFLHVRNPAAFESYLRRTVVNLANSHHRRARSERATLARRTALREPEAPQPDAGDTDVLRRVLLRLPPRQRTAIVLRFYEDQSERQTADAMRCATGTVKSLVSRGMETLRTALRDQRSE